MSSKCTNKMIIKRYLPQVHRSGTAASVFVPQHPGSCWWGIYRAATAEPARPCTCIPAPAGESLLWHVLATCTGQTCNHKGQLGFFLQSCLNVWISIFFPPGDVREGWLRGSLTGGGPLPPACSVGVSQPQGGDPVQESEAVWQHSIYCIQICSASLQAKEADSAPNSRCCGKPASGTLKEFEVALVWSPV